MTSPFSDTTATWNSATASPCSGSPRGACNIYSLRDLRQLMHAANDRYLAFMACLDNPDAGQRAFAEMAGPARVRGRSFRGFNLFLDPDYQMFLALTRGD